MFSFKTKTNIPTNFQVLSLILARKNVFVKILGFEYTKFLYFFDIILTHVQINLTQF